MGLENEGRKDSGHFCMLGCLLHFFSDFPTHSFCPFFHFENKVIADMEAQVHKLREELVNVNSQRKQQLVELGLLREQEKQRAARDHENVVSKLRAESEKMKIELKKTHAAETEMTLEKVGCPTRCFVDS